MFSLAMMLLAHTVLVSRKMIISKMKNYDLSKCQVDWMCRDNFVVAINFISRKKNHRPTKQNILEPIGIKH